MLQKLLLGGIGFFVAHNCIYPWASVDCKSIKIVLNEKNNNKKYKYVSPGHYNSLSYNLKKKILNKVMCLIKAKVIEA